MAVPTNTVQTYTQKNIREDLENTIYNVDPTKTPLFTMAKKLKAEQTYHEWNVDILTAQNTSNAQIQGDDATADSTNATGRMGNYTQISRKVVQIADTLQSVRAAGGSNKMGYQLLRSSKALKRDIEGSITKNAAQSAGSSSAAAVTGGLPSFLVTNVQFQTGGANPTGLVTVGSETFGNGTTARTAGTTPVAFTEAQFDTAVEEVYTSSGDSPDYVLCSPVNKQIISKFTGVGTRFTQVEDKTLKTAIDVIQSDFGEVKIVPDIFLAQSHDVYFVKSDMVRIAYLRPFKTVPLAKTGDSEKKMLVVEYALEVGNEHALGAVFDTTG